MLDWRLAGNGNVFGEFAQGYQTGQGNKLDRERVDAYKTSIQDQRGERERKAKIEEEARRLGQVTQVLKGLATSAPEGQRLQVFQKAAPMLSRFGLDVNELATTTEEELSDASLSMLIGNVEKAVEEYTLAPGAKRYRGNELVADNPAQPSGPISVPQGNTLVDPETYKPLYTAPKTYAPQRGGGRAAPKPPTGFIPDP